MRPWKAPLSVVMRDIGIVVRVTAKQMHRRGGHVDIVAVDVVKPLNAADRIESDRKMPQLLEPDPWRR